MLYFIHKTNIILISKYTLSTFNKMFSFIKIFKLIYNFNSFKGINIKKNDSSHQNKFFKNL